MVVHDIEVIKRMTSPRAFRSETLILVRSNGNLLISSNGTVKVVQRLQSRTLLEQHVALDPPWQGFGELVLSVNPRRYSKDVIQLFECSLLGLWYEEENEDQRRQIEPGIKGESTYGVEHLEDTWE